MEEFDFYPEKPQLAEKVQRNNIAVTIFSIVLFILTFVIFFGSELNFIVYLVVVILFHELGHFLMMKLFKYQNVRMLFVPLMGAFVQGEKHKYRQKQSFLVVLAGPVPGIVLGLILLYLGNKNQSEILVTGSLLFLFINMLNLVPLDPLDGGQLLKLLISKGQEKFQLILSLISSLILIALGYYIDSWLMIGFGFILGIRVRGLQKSYHTHKELNENEVNYKKTYKRLTNREFSKIKEILLSRTPALRMFIDQVGSDESDPILASQVNNVLITPTVRDASLLTRFLVIAVWILALVLPIWFSMQLDLKWYYDAL